MKATKATRHHLTQDACNPYLEYMMAHYPTVDIAPEMILELATIAKNPPKRPMAHIVSDVFRYFVDIRHYFKAAKKNSGGAILGEYYLEILHCVNTEFNYLRRVQGLAIANMMDAFVCGLSQDIILDRVDLSILCYLAVHNHELTLKAKNTIRAQINRYITHHRSESFVSISLIQSCLWIAEHYPLLAPQRAARWARSLSYNQTYRSTDVEFGSEFPFQNIGLSSKLGGDATLTVTTHNAFGAPMLYDLETQLTNVARFSQYGITLYLRPNGQQSREHLLWQLHYCLAYLERLIHEYTPLRLVDGQISNFREKTLPLLPQALIQHFADTDARFPEFRAYPLSPPRERIFDAQNLELYNLVARKQDAGLLRMQLASGHVNPNAAPLNSPLLHLAAGTIQEYTFYCLLGPLDDNHRKKLRERYTIIIAKHNRRITLHWQAHQSISEVSEITDIVTAEMLDALIEKKCDTPGVLLRVSSTADNIQLTKHLEPIVLPTWQKERMQAAQKKLSLIQTLIAYGADPCARPTIDGGPTLLNDLLNQAWRCHHDKVNLLLLKESIRAIFLADRGHSGIYIVAPWRAHPIGQYILHGMRARRASQQLPLRISAVLPSANRHALTIYNEKQESLTLETHALQSFIRDPRNYMGVIAVSASAFLKDKPVDAPFVEYVMKKLKPRDNGHSLIEVLRDSQSRIVGYCISDIVQPEQPGEPTLYYLRLAAAEPIVSQRFSKMMTIVLFQRTFMLKDFSAQVLTAFTAASAITYLMTAELPEVYPKKSCLKDADKTRLYQTFFKGKGRTPINKNQGMHFKSQMFYEAQAPSNQHFNRASDNEREFFNTLIKVPGCSTLVAFYATAENLTALARMINRRLSPDITLDDITAATTPLTYQAMLSPGAKL